MAPSVKTWKEYRADGNSTEAAMLMEIAELRARWAAVGALEQDQEFRRLLRRVADSDLAPGPVAALVAYIKNR